MPKTVPSIPMLVILALAASGRGDPSDSPGDTGDTKASIKTHLKVLATEFEPIGQGKNMVRVKVHNTSDAEQTCGIHIYTRSPDFGSRGLGWGTTFFDTIKPQEAKWLRYAFKIHGPITEGTYIKLGFYNPPSEKEYDHKKSFETIKYTSGDLEHKETGAKPLESVPQAQQKMISKTFRHFQQHVQNKNYKETWQLLTKDHQHAQFFNKYDLFIKAMDPDSPWSAWTWERAQFLDLRPVSITKKNNVFTLTAKRDDQLWTIDFILVEGQWKIDWIAGYTSRISRRANWKERLLPKMQERSTEHFDIHYFEASTAQKEIDQIAEQKEKGFRQICRFLGQDSDVRICLVLFEDGQTKHRETGHQGHGWAFGHTIVEIYNQQTKLDPYHETVHILMGSFGNPPALFNEGFAVYMSERLGAAALKSLGGGSSRIHERARKLKTKGEWIALAELLTYTEIGSKKTRPHVSYAEAASFVKYLIDKYGKDEFLQTYKKLKNPSDTTVQHRNVKKLERIYGKSLRELEQEWERAFTTANSE